MKNYSSNFTLYGKMALTVGLLYLLLYHLDFRQIGDLLHHIHPVLLLAAIGLHLLAFLCGSLRWWLLLQYIKPDCFYRDILPSYYLGLFCNNFLPTGFGGDVARAAYLATKNYPLDKLLSSTIMDRALGLLVLLLTGLFTMLVQNIFPVDHNTLLLLAGATLAFFITAWLLFSPNLLNWLRTQQQTSSCLRFYQTLINLIELFHVYRQARLLLLGTMLLSLLLQALVIGVYALLGNNLGLQLPLSVYFIIIPLVMLATNIPISLGGLGLREGALVSLLLGIGITYQQSVLLSLLYLFVLWITTLPGGLVLLQIRLPNLGFYKLSNIRNVG